MTTVDELKKEVAKEIPNAASYVFIKDIADKAIDRAYNLGLERAEAVLPEKKGAMHHGLLYENDEERSWNACLEAARENLRKLKQI